MELQPHFVVDFDFKTSRYEEFLFISADLLVTAASMKEGSHRGCLLRSWVPLKLSGRSSRSSPSYVAGGLIMRLTHAADPRNSRKHAQVRACFLVAAFLIAAVRFGERSPCNKSPTTQRHASNSEHRDQRPRRSIVIDPSMLLTGTLQRR